MARSTPSSCLRTAHARPVAAAAALAALALALPASAGRSAPSEPAASPETSAVSTPDAGPQQRGRAAPVQPRNSGRRGAAGARGRPAIGQRGGTAAGQGDLPLTGNPFGVPVEQKRKAWFQTADADSSGWVSFREARVALSFDAARFRVFDTDNDGRFTQDEYTSFLRNEVGSGRKPMEPRKPAYAEAPPPRDAEQLRVAYDVDLDGAVSRTELDRILRDYGGLRPGSRLELSAADVMQQLDTDGNQTLDVGELGRLANYLTPASVDPSAGAGARPGARTIDDLFVDREDRSDGEGPRIEGPVSTFRRLDFDGDGYITTIDLERLEGRAFSTVNLSSLINTLDIDFDGRLHEGEFLDALSPRRR